MNGTEPDLVFRFDRAALARRGGGTVVRDLDWAVREGQTWAIVGPVGSGKTTLAEVLTGQHRVESGALAWPLLDRLRAAGRPVAWASEVVRCVAFKEESWRFSYSRHYYQQRFNFVEPHDDLTLDDFLRACPSATEAGIEEVTARLGIARLRSLSLLKLSNGETRRARIARALLSRPELLVLDEPFMGVDEAGRQEVAAVLGQLIVGGLRVVLITRPESIPGWVTDVLTLPHPSGGCKPPVPLRTRGAHAPRSAGDVGEPVVGLKDVTVAYEGRTALRGLSWTVRRGERWAVLGPNGSGKTTLLSLLCGDHPQAYSNEVHLFGRRRGTGESIWDIKARVGLVSPEVHLYFSEPLTAFQTAVTGFYDVMAARRATPEQAGRVRQLFEEFDVAELLERPFAQLSTGEQRLVLLIRALVKEPPLLILDEPFQGFDDDMIARARQWLDTRLQPGQTLLFVSHFADEIPRTVDRRLRLEAGQVVEMR